MLKAASKTEFINNPLGDEPTSRKKIVGEQREVEEQLAYDKNGRAVFFVPFPLTPLYINHEAVEKNPESGLYILKEGYTIPENLIPDNKRHEPKQLSTVLGRVLSLWELKQNPVIIFYVEDRVKHKKHVDKRQLDRFLEEHKNFQLIKISQGEYDEFKTKHKNVSEATYAYCDAEKQPIRQCIFATQIINPNLPSDWQILEGQAAEKTINNLNELLKRHDQEPIPALETPTSEARITASAKALSNIGIFTPSSANEVAANTSSLPTPCRSPSCTSPK